MDSDSLSLIIRLQQEDVAELLGADKGKSKVDNVADFRVALESYEQCLDDVKTLVADETMARSLTQAVLRDGDTLTEVTNQEDLAASDRTFAMRLAGVRQGAVDAAAGPQVNKVDEDTLARLTALYVDKLGAKDAVPDPKV